MRYPTDDNPVYSIEIIDSLAQEIFGEGCEAKTGKQVETAIEESRKLGKLLGHHLQGPHHPFCQQALNLQPSHYHLHHHHPLFVSTAAFITF
ncbi:hypothetical protein ACH5RR_018252 [Cinchona calisaya]|uniref:Uncharacterized protein n=1 Tax=Cinchona calisaya TaxID=153742 RepID=A0ABD2ZM77_9GENT